jgi:hypothetical protein
VNTKEIFSGDLMFDRIDKQVKALEDLSLETFQQKFE